jgi:hypothetical protein
MTVQFLGNTLVNGESVGAYVSNGQYGTSTSQVTAVATANISLSGTPTLDGYATSNGQTVLVPNQSVPAQNGLYTVGTWVKMPTVQGQLFYILNGTLYANSLWAQTSATTFGALGYSPANLAGTIYGYKKGDNASGTLSLGGSYQNFYDLGSGSNTQYASAAFTVPPTSAGHMLAHASFPFQMTEAAAASGAYFGFTTTIGGTTPISDTTQYGVNLASSTWIGRVTLELEVDLTPGSTYTLYPGAQGYGSGSSLVVNADAGASNVPYGPCIVYAVLLS